MLRLSFLPLKNNSVIVGVNFLLDLIYPVISSNTIDTFLLLDYSLLSFYKYDQLFATCSALLYFFGTFCRRNIFQHLLIFEYLFYPENSRADSRKTSIIW